MANETGPDVLYVKSGFDNNRIALHEIDPAHPGGSVVVAGDKPTKVGNTAMVRARLRDQWLVEVSGEGVHKEADKRAENRVKMIESSLGNETAVSEQFADTRTWPGSEPTADEVMADANPKLVEAQREAAPKVPNPPKGDQKPIVKG